MESCSLPANQHKACWWCRCVCFKARLCFSVCVAYVSLGVAPSTTSQNYPLRGPHASGGENGIVSIDAFTTLFRCVTFIIIIRWSIFTIGLKMLHLFSTSNRIACLFLLLCFLLYLYIILVLEILAVTWSNPSWLLLLSTRLPEKVGSCWLILTSF